MAIKDLDAIEVDWSGRVIVHLDTQPAMQWDDVTKARTVKLRKADGLPAWEVHCIVDTDEGKRAIKLTHYGHEAPGLPELGPVRVGRVIVHPWGSAGKSGFWYEVPDGIAAVSSPRGRSAE